jgi:hypothetical protein
MNCDQFELIVLGLAREQLMDSDARDAGLTHAQSCVRCDGRLASERFLTASARAVVADIMTEKAPPRVEAALLAAFQQHAMPAASHMVRKRPMKTKQWWFLRPAAAAALILILISTVWLYSNSVNDGNEALTGVGPVDLPGPVVAAIETEDKTGTSLTDEGASVKRRQRVRRKSNQTEVVTQFYSLTGEEGLDSSEVAQVVRVELPASALSAAGISVGPDLAGVPVKAEVALGYDGLARAIRFVR